MLADGVLRSVLNIELDTEMKPIQPPDCRSSSQELPLAVDTLRELWVRVAFFTADTSHARLIVQGRPEHEWPLAAAMSNILLVIPIGFVCLCCCFLCVLQLNLVLTVSLR